MWHLTQFRYSNGDLLTLYRESITSSVFCCAKSTFSKEKAKITSSVFCYAKSTFSKEKAKVRRLCNPSVIFFENGSSCRNP